MAAVSHDLMKNLPRRTEIRRNPPRTVGTLDAPILQEDAGDREIPCRVAPLQSSTAFRPAYLVHQHPYSGTNLVGHGSHAWKTSGARFRRMNRFISRDRKLSVSRGGDGR